MPDNAAIQALSAIASPASHGLERASLPEGSASLWEWFQPGHVLELSAPARAAAKPSGPAGEASGRASEESGLADLREARSEAGASARSSVAARLLARAQAEGEPVVWVGELSLYPPDLAAVGVDLDALVIVQPSLQGGASTKQAKPTKVATTKSTKPAKTSAAVKTTEAMEAVRAAEVLLRSGAFGLLVLDLSREVPRGALTWLARLHGLLRLHASRLLVLTGDQAASLGPLVSLRVAPRCRRLSAERWVIEHEVTKSKLGARVVIRDDVRSAPLGASGLGVGPRLSKLPGGLEDGQATERCA